MEKLKIAFSGFWADFNPQDSFIYNILKKYYDLELSHQPDILFYEAFNDDHKKYDSAIKVFATNENLYPNFNECDYAVGYKNIDFGDRYIRRVYSAQKSFSPDTDYLNRKFCNFVYSKDHPLWEGSQLRKQFFQLLSGYKHIDSPGQVLRNMPSLESASASSLGRYPNKIEFLKGYKFTIAFENESGYTTEKMSHPMLANSIPIYWGNPDAARDYNPKAFINCHDFANLEEVVEYVKYLDTHDQAYLDMLRQPAMREGFNPALHDLENFYLRIAASGSRHRMPSWRYWGNHPSDRINKIIKAINTHILPSVTTNTPLQDIRLSTAYPHLDDEALERLCAYSPGQQLKANVCPDYYKAFAPDRENSTQLNGVLKSAAERFASFKKPDKAVRFINDAQLENQYRQLMALLWPQDVQGWKKVRVGGPHDGGYVMLDPGRDGVALSFGVGPNCTWDLEMAQNGWNVLQFDGTRSAIPGKHRNIRFFARNIAASPEHGENEISLAEIFELVGDERDMVLQMDIEGAEWGMLENADGQDLCRFRQIIAEFHGLANPANLEKYKKIFGKILKTHAPVHFHYNCYGPVLGFSNFLVSDLWEISFARRDKERFTPSQDTYPTALDTCNSPGRPDIFIGKFSEIAGEARSKPPKEMPEHLRNRYTSNGSIHVIMHYADDSKAAPARISGDLCLETMEKVKKRELKYYGNTINHLYAALGRFPVTGKTVAIQGLDGVQGNNGSNYEAVALAYGAENVIVFDYNPPVHGHEKVRCLSIDEFRLLETKPEAIISVSSIEHDGLGRYGDPLSPEGDFRAMLELKAGLAPGGLLFLSVPVGQDCLVFNLHRIYGPKRLPKLLSGWTFLGCWGLAVSDFSRPFGIDNYVQPVMVLSKNPCALNIPVFANASQKADILRLAAYGSFDRDYYMAAYPDTLTSQMDLISHYVIFGSKEKRNPCEWFDTGAYMASHPELDFAVVNPFLHYLGKIQN